MKKSCVNRELIPHFGVSHSSMSEAKTLWWFGRGLGLKLSGYEDKRGRPDNPPLSYCNIYFVVKDTCKDSSLRFTNIYCSPLDMHLR